jgi:AbrB family looped-hinge helix DNA binding protein
MAVNHEVQVGPEGRVLIPAEIRHAIGIKPGEKLVLRVESGSIVLIPRDAIKRRLQEMFADIDGSMAEELIAERRAEAARDLSDQ